MNKIAVALFDEHKLVQEGISALLDTIEDIEIIISCTNREDLVKSIAGKEIHVLIINVHLPDTPLFPFIKSLVNSFPKVKILVMSAHNNEKIIHQSIKAGARGFLAGDTGKNELIESIYTLRNGHEYYSSSITHILLKHYIHNIKNEKKHRDNDITNLSQRELEILKLWSDSNSNREIAGKLFISVRTVESHKNHIMQKLNLKTNVDLIKFAIKNNLTGL